LPTYAETFMKIWLKLYLENTLSVQQFSFTTHFLILLKVMRKLSNRATSNECYSL